MKNSYDTVDFKRNINEFRDATPDDLIERYSDRPYFHDDGITVVIAARDEPGLAVVLASLAENNRQSDGYVRVRPLVVENGSTDENRIEMRRIAEAMGATFVQSEESYKVGALKEAVKILGNEGRLGEPILFTDADSIVAPTWVQSLTEATWGDELAFASGRSTLDHGPNVMSTTLGKIALRFEDTVRLLTKKAPVGRGDNTALNFANDQDAIAWYLDQPSNHFVFEDDAIAQEFEERKARLTRLLGREAVVSSLDDRFKSIWQRIRVVLPSGQDWLFHQYEIDYPGIASGKRLQKMAVEQEKRSGIRKYLPKMRKKIDTDK